MNKGLAILIILCISVIINSSCTKKTQEVNKTNTEQISINPLVIEQEVAYGSKKIDEIIPEVILKNDNIDLDKLK